MLCLFVTTVGQIRRVIHVTCWRGVAVGTEALLFVYPTHAYQAPPASVMVIPIAFVGVICRPKRTTANKIVNTCLTFARWCTVSADRRSNYDGYLPATVILREPTLPFAVKLTTLRPNAMHPLINRTRSWELDSP